MANLDNLLKVEKHKVDEKQKVLARLFREQEELIAARQSVYDTIEKEGQLAATNFSDISVQQSFASFKKGAKLKIATLTDKISRLEIRIAIAQEEVRAAFAEFKKIEIVDRNRKEKERKARQKKEDETFDEIGINIHRRTHSDDSQ
ncbi:MAG: flagellar FliJ family protein [Pseudobdellovibrionaceae bacterium]